MWSILLSKSCLFWKIFRNIRHEHEHLTFLNIFSKLNPLDVQHKKVCFLWGLSVIHRRFCLSSDSIWFVSGWVFYVLFTNNILLNLKQRNSSQNGLKFSSAKTILTSILNMIIISQSFSFWGFEVSLYSVQRNRKLTLYVHVP